MNHFTVCVPVATVMSCPSHEAACTSEALYGEHITVLEDHGEWVKVEQHHDGYIGFLERAKIVATQLLDTGEVAANTHWVQTKSTLLYHEPDFKSPVVHRIPFASELLLTECATPSFSRTQCGHYVWTAHCSRLNQHHPLDPVSLGKSHFLGLPYRWGGRSTTGVDCSGLVQLLALSQGLRIPRDSGEQEQSIDRLVEVGDYQPMDLVYWPGHTGILISATELLHSTAHSMICVIEKLDAVVERAGLVSSVRRLFTKGHSR